MKKQINLLLASLLLILSCSCKKEATDIPIGTIKVEINGVPNTFSVQAKATRIGVTGGYGIQVQGNYRTGSTTNLTITVVRPSSITSGTYTENAASNPLVSMTHCVEVFVPCVLQSKSYGSSSNPLTVSITELNSSSIKGTFSGELQSAGSGGNPPTKELFTNGVFHVSF